MLNFTWSAVGATATTLPPEYVIYQTRIELVGRSNRVDFGDSCLAAMGTILSGLVFRCCVAVRHVRTSLSSVRAQGGGIRAQGEGSLKSVVLTNQEQRMVSRNSVSAAFILLVFGTFAMADETSRILFGAGGADSAKDWQTVNDGVMGGVSEGQFKITDKQTMEFFGNLCKRRGANGSKLKSRWISSRPLRSAGL
ncbi:MAG: CIA30 family protein [Planctomycetaceae bacterium]